MPGVAAAQRVYHSQNTGLAYSNVPSASHPYMPADALGTLLSSPVL